jgi:tripartite-type tricarboxylate transporter receptor subunit TctC
MNTRRDVIRTAAAAALIALAGAGGAAAQAYPSGPVTIIVGYSAGGPTDLMARFVAKQLSELWGQPVVVENRPGASGTLAGDYVARAEPDGLTLLMGNNAAQGTYELLNPSTTPYITMEAFEPISLIGLAPLVMVTSNKVPADSVQSFVAWAKERPGEVNYASAAVGSATQMASEFLSDVAGLDMEMIVYPGAAPALQSIIAGETDMYMGGYSTVAEQGAAGNLKLIAVAADERIPPAPDLPTFREAGIDYSYGSWFGLLAPAKVPAEILDRINADVTKVLSTEESNTTLLGYGFVPKVMDRAGFRTMLEKRIASDAALIKKAGIPTN